jgi:hypothetical protein
MSKYIVVTWPEIQAYQDCDCFELNSYLINDEPGLTDFGASAYFVRENWYNYHKERLYGKAVG